MWEFPPKKVESGGVLLEEGGVGRRYRRYREVKKVQGEFYCRGLAFAR
jgi:hypothetical protein